MDINRVGEQALQGASSRPIMLPGEKEVTYDDRYEPVSRLPIKEDGEGRSMSAGIIADAPGTKAPQSGVVSASGERSGDCLQRAPESKGNRTGREAPILPAEEKLQTRASSPIFEIPSGGPKEESLHIAQEIIKFAGIKPQSLATAVRDLTALPLPLLKLLEKDELNIGILKEGQSLADTPLLPSVKPEEYGKLAEKGRMIFEEVAKSEEKITESELKDSVAQGNEDAFHLEMIRYWETERLKKKLEERLIAENLGFSVTSSREPVNLRELARSQNVEESDMGAWEETFRRLNEGFVSIQDGMAEASKGVMLIPYCYYRGRPVSRTSLESYKHYDSKYVKDSLGVHLWEDRMVILHEDYITDPGLEVGHYRILLHEVGHAIDHAIERIPGIGEKHAQRLNDLFQRDKNDLKSGGPNRFISPRAMDNVREYFAEAIESYMTVPMHDEHEYYKGSNTHDDLRRINPELFAFVDEIIQTDYGV